MASAVPLEETLDDFDDTTRERGGEIERGRTVGRYVILSRAGAGGMGVVYAAYDPDLDRRVALKLLHPERERSHDGLARLLREAQAMGKLNHPNVVVVHDVGEHAGGVFLAMEFVEGRTMRAWANAATRDWRVMSSVLRQAGEGLAAAHAKGLVHRDFKPDNVLIGDDGRVRVMDFGLVCVDARRDATPSPADSAALPATGLLRGGLTRSGSILGTPRYMAPEQWRGGEVGAAADQFAFCLTAYEMLYGERAFEDMSSERQAEAIEHGVLKPPPRGSAVPQWLRRVILRGLEPEPTHRWPSMESLLVEMRRDPSARRRAVAAAAGIAGVAALGLGVWQWDQHRREEACALEGATLVRAWDDAAQAGVHEAMLGTGVGHAAASFDRASAELTGYAAAWSSAAADLCVAATIEHTVNAEHHGLARACLAERATDFGEVVRILGTPDSNAVNAAVPATLDLPRVERCMELEVLARSDAASTIDHDAAAAVRDMLAQAAARRRLGDFDGAREMAEQAHEQAGALDAPVLEAQAELELGVAQLELAQYDEASARLQSAILQAGASGADGIAAQASQRLVHLVGSIQGRPDEGLMWAGQAQMWLDRVAAPADDPRRALVASARAIVVKDRGEWAAARTEFERAVVLLGAALGDDHPETGQARHNLGIVEQLLGETEAGLRDLQLALASKERAWGPEHPEVAATLAAYGEILMAADRRDEAIVTLRRALAIRESALGPDHAVVAHSLYSLAHPLGPTDEAVGFLERAVAINERAVGPEHPDTAMCISDLGLIALDRGQYDEAKQHFTRASTIFERALGGDHPMLAHLLFNLSRATDKGGDMPGAQVVIERAAMIGDRALGPTDGFVGDLWLSVGRGRLELGDAAGAVVALERAVTRYQDIGDSKHLDGARTSLAKAHAATTGNG